MGLFGSGRGSLDFRRLSIYSVMLAQLSGL